MFGNISGGSPVEVVIIGGRKLWASLRQDLGNWALGANCKGF